MDILFVADVSIATVLGGAERVVYEQSKLLANRGYNVNILTRKLPDHEQSQAEINGIVEWRYPVNSKNSFIYLVSTISNARALFTKLHKACKYDYIHFHQPFTAFGVLKSNLSKNIKKIYTCHSLSFEEFKSRTTQPKGLIGKSLFSMNVQMRKWIEKKVLRSSNKIVVLSQFTQDKLWKAYKIPSQKVTIIPGGIDLKRFYPAMDKISIRKKLNIPQEKTVLFTVRNLVQRMGLENLITAMKKVSKTASDIYLVIGGHGPLKDDLITLTHQFGLEEQIEFTGFIPDDDLSDYYRMADLFVLPTKELEGFGLVTLEAMASGVPVVGTPVGGTLEILGKFDSDFIFKDTTAESMAELIVEKYQIIKKNPDGWAEMSKKCRKFVEDNYPWEKHVNALEKVMKK